MKKILLSLGTLAIVGVIVAGATGAFFTDTETSTGNTFTAGSIDLKVDSTSHYNGFTCTEGENGYTWKADDGTDVTPNTYPQPGDACNGTWAETDLGAQKFFNFTDLKPGDHGEDTISLHVYDNDAWGRFVMTNTVDSESGCTEPELKAEPNCTPNGTGQLGTALDLNVWLDQGAIPGFQNTTTTPDADPTEGDNIHQENEPMVNITGTTSTPPDAVTYDLWGALANAYSASDCLDTSTYAIDGHDGYGKCQGLAKDGRMVGDTNYNFGVEWNLPASTGNEVQSDQLESDFSFDVVQHRNNPSKTF